MNLYSARDRLSQFVWPPIALALGVPLALLAVRLAFWSMLPGYPFVAFIPAVFLVAVLLGWAPGALSAVFSAVLGMVILVPMSDLGALYAWVGLGFYLLVSGSIVAIAYMSDRATAELRALNRNQAEAAQALKDSETRFRLAAEASGAGVWEWRLETNEMIYSDRAKQICGFPIGQPVTFDMVSAVTHPDDFPNTREQSRRALDPDIRDTTPYDYRLLLPNGEVRWVVAHGEAVFEQRGGHVMATRYIGTIVDVTERKQAEDHLLLLAREVDHRANNLMAVVQSTVALSKADTAAELRTVIKGRIQALARAHQLLSEGRWKGMELRRLLEEELLPFSLGQAERVVIDGPSVNLSPAAGQGLAIVLHELATNAAKYGALSSPAGTVRASWTVSPEGRLALVWREAGGPAVRKPTRKGFGASLLERALGGALKGETRLIWKRDGLTCELELPNVGYDPALHCAQSDMRQTASV